MARVHNVLVLRQGYSACSIMADAIVNREFAGQFRGFTSGSSPKASPHPTAIAVLRARGHDASQLRSKSWSEFTCPSAPVIDIVITVCDEAAGEACPHFPGGPIKVHWGMPDPDANGEQQANREAAFKRAYDVLVQRIGRLAAIADQALDGPNAGQLLYSIADIETEV